MKKVILFISIVWIFGAALAAPILPHIEIVKKHLKNTEAWSNKVASCKGIYMTPNENDIDCWAAHVAKDMSLLPVDTRELVLDAPKRAKAISRCQALSMRARFDSRECAAAGQSETFVSLRLPRMKLEPVKFK